MILALIPARSGSKRIPDKNIRVLGDKPLLHWTIDVARQTGLFDNVIVSSDSKEYLKMANERGATAWKRAPELSTDESTDFDWIMEFLDISTYRPDYIFLLRPTSPFRTVDMLMEGFELFRRGQRDGATSLRAISPVTEHPYKMWTWQDTNGSIKTPFHDTDYHTRSSQSLKQHYVQNGSLEIFPFDTINNYGNIYGDNVIGYVTPGITGFDLNSEADWREAEWLLNTLS